MNRLIKQEPVDIDGEIVVQYIYTLGAVGEKLPVFKLDRTVEYTYDSLYRLTSETITEGEKETAYAYAYDKAAYKSNGEFEYMKYLNDRFVITVM